MIRRRFLFWIGFGLFNLSERLRADGLDSLAAKITEAGGGAKADAATLGATRQSRIASKPTHWRAANNAAWQWYDRETLIDGRWTLTGVTTPVSRETGQP
jgi:hypothetical protein